MAIRYILQSIAKYCLYYLVYCVWIESLILFCFATNSNFQSPILMIDSLRTVQEVHRMQLRQCTEQVIYNLVN
jgi:hypothetical protein